MGERDRFTGLKKLTHCYKCNRLITKDKASKILPQKEDNEKYICFPNCKNPE